MQVLGFVLNPFSNLCSIQIMIKRVQLLFQKMTLKITN